jgi:hypothetical protein
MDKKNGRDYERLVKPVKFSKIFCNVWFFENFRSLRDFERLIYFEGSNEIWFWEEENE